MFFLGCPLFWESSIPFNQKWDLPKSAGTLQIQLGGRNASFRSGAARVLADELSKLATVCRYRLRRLTYLYGDDYFREDYAAYVDPSFLSLFSFPVLYGNREALSNPQNILISRTLAEKLARDRAIADLVGTPLTLVRNNTREHFTISGMVETFSDQSSLQFDLLIPYQRVTQRAASDQWGEFEAMLFLSQQKRDIRTPEASLALLFRNLLCQTDRPLSRRGAMVKGRVSHPRASSTPVCVVQI